MLSFLDRTSHRQILAIAALPVLTHAGLLAIFDLASRPTLVLALMFLGFVSLAPAARRLASGPRAVKAILGVAVVLRLLLLPLPPTLSDDALRYLWDGRVTGSGLNPYSLPPDAPELAPLRDDLWERLPHRQVATVYPPLALAAFSIAARFPAPLLALKLVLTLADLAGCALLLRLARRLELPEGRVIWFAWNPLVTVETAGMGHVDALGVSALLLACWLLLRRPPRPAAAGAAAAAGVLVKLVPVAALPILARRSARPWRLLTAAAVLLLAGLAPVVVTSGGVPPGLVEYGVSWEFNGPLYEPLWRLLEHLEASRAVSFGLDRLKRMTGKHELWNRLYPFNYPQLLAKLLLTTVLLAALLPAWRRRRLVPAMGRVFGTLILCSATVYPWYLLWVLPWAALAQQTAWLSLSGLILLSYIPQLTPVALFPWVHLAIWGPFFLLLLKEPKWSTD